MVIMKSRRERRAAAVTASAGPAVETATTTARAAGVLLGFIVDVGHWGMAVVGLGLAFSVVAFVTRFDAATQAAMSAPEFAASLAFSAVLVTARTFIHVTELRHGWVDPYEVPVATPPGLSADGQRAAGVEPTASGQLPLGQAQVGGTMEARSAR
jgi:hypothetical protein